jgi:hypothetical protein
MKLKHLLAGLLSLITVNWLSATPLLSDLNFGAGRWEMVGVSLANHKLPDFQMDLGTFILTDQYILKQIQNKWDFEETFDDYCDYHYALKFYRNGELQKTLRANLLCNYITDGAFSYQFTEAQFLEYRRYFNPIRWSRIRFRDLDLLQVAVKELDEIPNVYWYGDVQQYHFDGEFSITVRDLPWNANRDSVVAALTDRIGDQMGREDFYITEKYWLLSPDFEKMELRLNVFCNEAFYKAYKEPNVVTWWRSHFSEQSFVQIVVIGLSKEEYYSKMEGYN